MAGRLIERVVDGHGLLGEEAAFRRLARFLGRLGALAGGHGDVVIGVDG